MKDNNIDGKAIMVVMIVLLALAFCFLLLLYKNEGWIDKIDLENIAQTTDFIWDIDELHIGQDSIQLKGIFYKEGETINYFNNRVMLRDKDSGIVYKLPTESFPKKEIVAEEDEMNYRNILAIAQSTEFDFVNRDYEILFLHESKGVQSYQETGYTVTSWGNRNEK